MNAPLTIFLDMALAVSLMFQKQMSIHFSTGSDKMAIANSGKSHFFTSPCERRSLKIHDSIITSSSSEKLFGVLIDSELTFHDHISRLCSKPIRKRSALARFSKYITLQKRHLLMSSYINSQFNFCPLI